MKDGFQDQPKDYLRDMPDSDNLKAMLMAQPISRARWLRATDLFANDYNPNNVFTPELKLLKQSILKNGWTMPIVALPTGQIIDGFHRWSLASSDKEINTMTEGFVPVVVLDIDEVERRVATVRHNRARGVHAVQNMSNLVKDLIARGATEDDLMRELGMEREEVKRLSEAASMTDVSSKDNFGKAWKPSFDTNDKELYNGKTEREKKPKAKKATGKKKS